MLRVTSVRLLALSLPIVLAGGSAKRIYAFQPAPAAHTGRVWPSTDSPTDAIEMSHDDERRFAVFLTEFTKRANVAVIVEGEPFVHSLTDDAAETLPTKGSIHVLLEAVAKAYDYRVLRGNALGTVYLLEKRYTDPTDMPPITLDEATGVVEGVRSLLDQFDPRVGFDPKPIITPFCESLTADQVRLLVDPTGGLALDQLDGPQRSAVEQLVDLSYTRIAINDLFKLAREIKALASPQAAVGWTDSLHGRKVRLFGIMAPILPRKYFRPLSSPETYHSDAAGGVTIANGHYELQADDPTAPDPPRAGVTSSAEAAQLGAAPMALPLREAITAALPRASSGPGPRIEVADSIAATAIVIANPTAATPDDIVHGVSTLYGFAIKTDFRNGATLLDRPRTPRAAKLEDLPIAMRQILPPPFARAVHLDIEDGNERRMHELTARLQELNRLAAESVDVNGSDKATIQANIGEEIVSDLQEQDRLFWVTPRRLDGNTALQRGAVKRLRTLVESVLTGRKSEAALLPSLGDGPRTAIAALLQTDLFPILRSYIVHGLPLIVKYQDALVLRGSKVFVDDPQSPGKKRSGMRVTLYCRTPDGKLTPAGASYFYLLEEDTAPSAPPSAAAS